MLAIYLSLLETEAQRDKFEWLYQRYAGLLYQVAFSVVKEHFLAEDVAISEESFERLVNCVKSMDELYRAPLELRMQGYKITQIAKFLEMNPQTVKVRLYRARKMLLQQLEDEPHGSKEG